MASTPNGSDAVALQRQAIAAALAIATELGWDQVRLHRIAERTGLPLAEIGRHFADVDAVANAWLREARLAMLAIPWEEMDGRPADEQIGLAFGRWLDHLAPHRRLAGEILRDKLHPPHLHHWVPLIFDLSRLVHDLLDVARVEGDGRLRQAQEVGLTLIVLATLGDWLRDDGPGQHRAKDRLARRLARAGWLARRLEAGSRH